MEFMNRPAKMRGVSIFGAIALSMSTLALTLTLAQLVIAAGSQTPTTGVDWLQFGFDSRHSGNNPQETIISVNNVSSLQKLYQITLPSVADGAPVYLSQVNTPGGVQDLLFVTTLDGHLIALNAQTGAVVWSKQNPAGSCTIGGGTTPCFSPSSPAIDPNRQYIYAYGLEGRIHKYNVGDGSEVVTGGWPQISTLKPIYEKASSNLSIATVASGTSYLYMTHAGYNDAGDYQGHITAINLSDNTQKVFNALCSNQAVHFITGGSPNCPEVQAGIWARPAVVYDPDTQKVYATSSNGQFDPANHYWGNTVMALNPDGTGANGDPLDTFTPTNYQTLDTNDWDLGSTAPAILPPAGGKYPHLSVQGGKEGILYLLNMDNLSNANVPGPGIVGGEVFSMTVPQTNQVLPQPAVWVNPNDNATWVFVATRVGLSGLKLTIDGQGNPRLVTQWVDTSQGTTSPIIANGILYFAATNSSPLGNFGARDPITGNVLWSDSTWIGPIHWQSPILVNGVLYITDRNSHLTAFAPTVLSTSTSTPTASSTATRMNSPTATFTRSPTLTPLSSPTATPTSSPTATPTRTPSTTPIIMVEDNSINIRYNGWRGVSDTNADGGTYRVSNEPNDSATFRFTGKKVTWITFKGPSQGKAQILIDGTTRGTFDLYASTLHSESITFRQLGNTKHVLVVKVLGQKNAKSKDTNVSIDGFRVGANLTQDDSSSIRYTAWGGHIEPRASGGSYRSARKGAVARFTFTGTSVDWITAMGPAYGKAKVSIDRHQVGPTIDLYAATQQWQVAIPFENLSNGPHIIEIKVLGTKNAQASGSNIIMDGFRGPFIIPAP
jgi:outer membrane protein assembly factor BamB